MIAYASTIFVSAFLLFQVQPLIGKKILPWFGGTPAVWNTCMLFFQIALLLGYAYAHFVVKRLRPRGQMLLHFGVLAATLVFMPIGPTNVWKPTGEESPNVAILLMLAATIGLPYFLLSTTGPLLQDWFRRANPGASPYRLYALSNVGSLFALLSYPFVFEPNLAWSQQSWCWTAVYGLFVLGCGWCAWQVGVKETNEVTTTTSTAIPPNPSPTGSAYPSPLPPTPLGSTRSQTMPTKSIDFRPPGLLKIGLWIMLAALGSVMFMATTNMMCMEVPTVPLLYILPLALYLVSFIVTFENERWYRRPLAGTLLLFFGTWAMVVMIEGAAVKVWFQVPAYLGVAFAGCYICNGELARSKPHPQYLTLFYLMLALGGAIGGALVAVVCPIVFDGLWELPLGLGAVASVFVALTYQDFMLYSHDRRIALATVLAIGLPCAIILGVTVFPLAKQLMLTGKIVNTSLGFEFTWKNIVDLIEALFAADAWKWWVGGAAGLGAATALAFVDVKFRAVLAASIGAIIMLGAINVTFLHENETNKNAQFVSRTYYGMLRIFKYHKDDYGDYYQLLNGNIDHGFQLDDEEKRFWPTSYYSQGSGIGEAIRKHPLRVADAAMHIGVIGLGTGTIATYGKPADRIRFYEINPMVEQIAQHKFTHLSDCQGTVTVVLGDARISMEREAAKGESQQFDVLAIDAFSSDSIPLHLLTKECMQVYLQHMKPDGVIAFHISNRHLNLAPVVRALAEEFKMDVRRISNEEDSSQAALSSDWVLVSKNWKLLEEAAAVNGKAFAEDVAEPVDPPIDADTGEMIIQKKKRKSARTILFTDDTANLWQVIDW